MSLSENQMEKDRVLRFAIWIRSLRLPFAVCLIASMSVGIVFPWFVAKPEYLSNVVFVPPPESQGQLFDIIGMKDRLMSSKSDLSNDQIVVLFESESFRRQIIDRFNLISRYKIKGPAPYSAAIKVLKEKLVLEETKSSGIGFSSTQSFKIRCWDRSPDTAKQICEFSFQVLDSSIARISSNRAQTILSFASERARQAEKSLDSVQQLLVKFQKATKIAEPELQTKMMMEATARLSEKLTAAKFSKQMAVATQGSGSAEESSIAALQNSIEKELQSIQYAKNSRLPSLAVLSEGAPKYYSLMREVEIQLKILGLLRQQEELARLDVSKTRSSLYLLDPARVPEYKDRPKRASMAIIIVLSGMMLFVVFALYLFVSREAISRSDFLKAIFQGRYLSENK